MSVTGRFQQEEMTALAGGIRHTQASVHLDLTAIQGMAFLGSADDKQGAFANCKMLLSMSLPDSVQFIGNRCFFQCTAFKEITLPKRLHTIGAFAFAVCTSLKTLAIPDHTHIIGEGAFVSCTALKEINLPESLETIGYGAFAMCSALEALHIPKTVHVINPKMFIGNHIFRPGTPSNAIEARDKRAKSNTLEALFASV